MGSQLARFKKHFSAPKRLFGASEEEISAIFGPEMALVGQWYGPPSL